MSPRLRRAWGITPGRLAGRLAVYPLTLAALILLMLGVIRLGAAELARVMEALP